MQGNPRKSGGNKKDRNNPVFFGRNIGTRTQDLFNVTEAL